MKFNFSFSQSTQQQQQHCRCRGPTSRSIDRILPISLIRCPFLDFSRASAEKKEIPAKSTAAANLFRTDSYRHIMHSTKFVENNNLCFRIIELFEKKKLHRDRELQCRQNERNKRAQRTSTGRARRDTKLL